MLRNCHLLSDFSSKFKSSMIIFHYENVHWNDNIYKLIHKKCNKKSWCSDIKFHVTLNTISSVLLLNIWWVWGSVQVWSLQCPSNAIWPFKTYLSENNPSKRNPNSKMKTLLEVLNIICPSQEPTSEGHCHYKK